jgi:hypothetical protein
VGLLPLFVLPLAYGLTFDGQTLSEADLERVRQAARALRAEAAAGAGGPPRRHDDAAATADQHPFVAPGTTRTSEAV